MANGVEISFRERVENFFMRDGAMALSRVLIGAVLGAVVGMHMPSDAMRALAVAGVGFSMVALTGFSHRSIERQRQSAVANIYRDEIGAALGKSPKEVTRLDALEMAEPDERGRPKSMAIKRALDYFETSRNFYVAAQATTAAVVTAGVFAASFSFGVPTIALAGIASLAYNEVYHNVVSLGLILFPEVERGTVTKEIKAIEDQIALGGRISSTRILGVFVIADPLLKQRVNEHYGQNYESISIGEKRQLVQFLDPYYNLYKLTDDINRGNIQPSELGFVAFGQHSGVPRKENTLVPHGVNSYIPDDCIDSRSIDYGQGVDKAQWQARIQPAAKLSAFKAAPAEDWKERTAASKSQDSPSVLINRF